VFSGVVAILIAIEVSGAELPADEQHALEDACSAAVGGRCEIGAPQGGEAPDAVAIVSLSEDRERATIELGRRRQERGVWLSRELDFEPEDARNERLRAVGLTIATLFGDVEEREATEAAEAAPPPPPVKPPPPSERPPAEPPAAPEPAPERWIGLLALAALTGPGLSTGGWRFGGTARASLRHPSFVLWPTLSGWYTSQPIDDDGLAVSWFGVGAGLVLGRDWQALDLSGRLRGEGMIERLAIEQTRAPVDHGSRWVPGLKLGADATWPASGPVGAIIGGDLDLYQNETVVRVAGTDVARAGARNYSLLLGVELRLP